PADAIFHEPRSDRSCGCRPSGLCCDRQGRAEAGLHPRLQRHLLSAGCSADRRTASRADAEEARSSRRRWRPLILPPNHHRRTTMKPRMNFYQAAPETMKALMALENQIQASGLEQSLIELVRTRASQINGCAFCVNMHTQDARKRGETEQRLYLLNAWRE